MRRDEGKSKEQVDSKTKCVTKNEKKKAIENEIGENVSDIEWHADLFNKFLLIFIVILNADSSSINTCSMKIVFSGFIVPSIRPAVFPDFNRTQLVGIWHCFAI